MQLFLILLNHASIIDGVSVFQKRSVFATPIMIWPILEKQLIAANEAGASDISLIATDGVFSMDGYIANLRGCLRSCLTNMTHW